MKNKTPKKKNEAGFISGVQLTEPLKEELLRFIEYCDANRLGRNLRNLLIEFMMYDGATESLYFRDLIQDLQGLYRLLDCIEHEGKGPETS